jgi:rhodanese-related sulfurtransferase
MEVSMNRKLMVWLALSALAAVVAVSLVFANRTVRRDIGGSELLQLQSGGASIVDVRTPQEFAAGHVASAINVPVDQIQQVAAAWDKGKPVVVYCATGARSADAAAYLAGAGFLRVYNLAGGVAGWKGVELVGGTAPGVASSPAAGTVKTAGKPVFIEFATST